MKVRLILSFLAVCLGVVALAAAPASAAEEHYVDTSGIPAETPALDLLYARSSTAVHAGASVDVSFNFVHVRTRPWAELYYRSPSGAIVSTPLDVNTAKVTVPSDWQRGDYRLVMVRSENGFGATGEQFRSHLYVGNTTDGRRVYGVSNLQLRALDLEVV